MNKHELVVAASEISGVPRTCVDKVLKALIEATIRGIEQDGKVKLSGFGTFKTRERAAHVGRNPRTGKPIKIHYNVIPVFKAGKTFREVFRWHPREKFTLRDLELSREFSKKDE